MKERELELESREWKQEWPPTDDDEGTASQGEEVAAGALELARREERERGRRKKVMMTQF